jgi:hypothetical protein
MGNHRRVCTHQRNYEKIATEHYSFDTGGRNGFPFTEKINT